MCICAPVRQLTGWTNNLKCVFVCHFYSILSVRASVIVPQFFVSPLFFSLLSHSIPEICYVTLFFRLHIFFCNHDDSMLHGYSPLHRPRLHTDHIVCVHHRLGRFFYPHRIFTQKETEKGERRLTPGRTPFIIFIHIASTKLLSYFFFSFFLPFFIHMNVYIIPLAYFVFRLRVCVSYLNEEGRKHSACSSGSGLWKEPECVYILAVHRRFRQKCFFL